jgi:hypothetical protein
MATILNGMNSGFTSAFEEAVPALVSAVLVSSVAVPLLKEKKNKTIDMERITETRFIANCLK